MVWLLPLHAAAAVSVVMVGRCYCEPTAAVAAVAAAAAEAFAVVAVVAVTVAAAAAVGDVGLWRHCVGCYSCLSHFDAVVVAVATVVATEVQVAAGI